MSVRVLTPAASDIINVTAKAIKVDQHSQHSKNVNHSHAKAPGAYDLCPGITTSELFITLTKRLNDLPEQLSDVDNYYLFAVWQALDVHIEEDAQQQVDQLPLPDDVPVKSAFASVTGDDDEDVDNWELRTLFRQDAINDLIEMESDAF